MIYILFAQSYVDTVIGLMRCYTHYYIRLIVRIVQAAYITHEYLHFLSAEHLFLNIKVKMNNIFVIVFPNMYCIQISSLFTSNVFNNV